MFYQTIGRWQGSSVDYRWLREAEKDLREECDTLAQTMIKDLGNESGSLENLLCYTWGFDLWLESEDEGGPSSEYKRSAVQQLRPEKKNKKERRLSICCVAAQTLKDNEEFASSFAFSISS